MFFGVNLWDPPLPPPPPCLPTVPPLGNESVIFPQRRVRGILEGLMCGRNDRKRLKIYNVRGEYILDKDASSSFFTTECNSAIPAKVMRTPCNNMPIA